MNSRLHRNSSTSPNVPVLPLANQHSPGTDTLPNHISNTLPPRRTNMANSMFHSLTQSRHRYNSTCSDIIGYQSSSTAQRSVSRVSTPSYYDAVRVKHPATYYDAVRTITTITFSGLDSAIITSSISVAFTGAMQCYSKCSGVILEHLGPGLRV